MRRWFLLQWDAECECLWHMFWYDCVFYHKKRINNLNCSFRNSAVFFLNTGGYFCSVGSVVSNPVLGLCPAGMNNYGTPDFNCSFVMFQVWYYHSAGHYCPPNVDNPIACPLGTLNTARGANNSLACVACPIGFFCNTTGIGVCPWIIKLSPDLPFFNSIHVALS